MTDQKYNTNNEMVSAKKTVKELEKQDWFQQMQQEEEGDTAMISEENTP
jgi:hypothetical protein